MKHKINVCTVTYGVRAEGEDDLPIIDEDKQELTFDTALDLAWHLSTNGIVDASDSEPTACTWLSCNRLTWDGNYTGHREHISVNNVDVPERLWIAIINRVREG